MTMKDITTIIKANVRHGKSGFFSVLILMFIISMTLTAVFTISINSANRNREALEHAGFGDFYGAFTESKLTGNQITIEELVERVEDCDAVKRVQTTECAFLFLKDLNGYNSGSSVVVEEYNPEIFDFEIFDDAGEEFLDKKITLNNGEICVPIAYKSMYDCNIGDVITFDTPDGETGFQVKYFFEDPFMGGSMMGIKTVLVTKEDLTMLSALDVNQEEGIKGYVLNVFQADKEMSAMKFEQTLNKETNFTGYGWITLATSQSASYMLILTNIFCGILLAFVILLLGVTLIIVGHSISTGIELEYVKLGIFKAVGMSTGRLKLILMIQYLIAAVIGMIVGIPVAVPVIAGVNKMTIPVTGLCVSNNIPFSLCILVMMAILAFIALFIIIKLRKISTITPIRAISGGRESIYFSNPFEVKVRKRGLNFFLALRQLTSGLKQYVSVCFITALLGFFLIMVNGMSTWIGDDGSNLSSMFNCFEAEVDIRYSDQALKDETEELIEKTAGIDSSYEIYSQYLMIDGYQVYCFICEDPEEFSSIYQGRTCKYKNEILITEFVADELDIHIGDTVVISAGEIKQEFMVVGIYQCANDMGKNFAMSKEAYISLTGNDKENDRNTRYAYRLNDKEKAEELISVISEKYNKEQVEIEKFESFNKMDSIVSAVQGISVLIYVIAVIFVLVTIQMVCGKIFAREITDISIYRAIGVTNQRLGIQFAFRFGIVAFVGSIIGAVLCILLSDSLMGFMFRFMGISQFETDIYMLEFVIPTIFMVAIYMIFSSLIFKKNMKGKDLTIKN